MRFLNRARMSISALSALIALTLSTTCGGGGGGGSTPPPAPPSIASFTAQPATITAGGSATLSFAFTGGTGSIDQGVGAVTSGTSVTVTPAVTTAYQLRVVNGAGATALGTATVTVAPAPVAPVISAPTLATAGAAGMTASVAAQAGMTYAWTITGGTITGGSDTRQITFTPGGSGTLTLTCTVTNAASASASGSATVTVVDAPVATGLAASTSTPLYGGSVTLTPTFTGGTGSVDRGVGPVVSGVPFATPALTATTTYTLTVANQAGATAVASVTVTPQTPTVGAVSPAMPTMTVLASQTFTSQVSGAVNGALTWTATGGTMDPATGAWTAPGTAGLYTITATSVADATRSASTVVTVVPAPVAVVTTLDTAAAGRKGITAAVADQPGMTYAWTITGGTITSSTTSSQITYTAGSPGTLTLSCTVTNAALATAEGSATVSVIPVPWINAFTADPLGVQSGGAATLHFDFVGGTGSLDQAIGPVTSLSDLTVHPTATTTYTLTVTPPSGSPIAQTATVTVGTLPTFPVDLPAARTVVQGQNPTLSVTTSASPAVTKYQWYFNGSPVPSGTGSSLTLYSVLPSQAGNYHVVATNLVGSTQSGTLVLSVTPVFSVSGRATLVSGGAGIPGVTVSLDTAPTPATAVTDSAGYFHLPVILPGSYTLTASMAAGTNVLFLPSTQPVTVADANVLDRQFQAALGYAVSGTVDYAGARTGRIYLRLDGGPGGMAPGVSLSAKGAFTIRGVPPGTYTLTAWMDTLGKGSPNASDPTGTRSAVVVGFGDASGADVALADPPSLDLAGLVPSLDKVSPMDGGAMLRWTSLRDAQEVEVADAYLVQWSTSSGFATTTGSATVPAQGRENPMVIAPGLANGTPYYFRLYGKAGATTSAPSAVYGPVTPAPATGQNAVSGTVSFTGTASGPLYVGLFDQSTQTPYAVRIASPVSPQAFTIPGVPSGSTYFHFAILDQNANGFIDLGDFTNIDRGDLTMAGSRAGSFLAVAGNLSGQNLALSSAPAIAYLGTSHQSYASSAGTFETYGLQVNLRSNAKLPVNAALLVGPTVLDLGKPGRGRDFWYWFNFGTLRPTVGDSVTLQVGYGDGTSEDLPVAVASVLDALPTIQPMTGTPTQPVFNWVAPVPLPGVPYSYRLWIAQKTGPTLWQYPSDRDMPSTQLSVPYNADGRASQPSLTAGVAYMWSISLRDANGNSTERKVDYTP